MKVNLLGTLMSLAFGALLAGVIIGLSSELTSDRIVLIVMTGIAAFACGVGFVGVTVEGRGRATNIRALASTFAVIFAIALAVLGFTGANAVVTGCVTGILLLVYTAVLSKIGKMHM